MKKYSILLGALFLWYFSFSQKTVSINTAPTNVITCSDFHISRPLSELSAENPIVEKQKGLSGEVEESSDRGHRNPQTFLHSADQDPVLYGNDPASIQTEMGARNSINKAPIRN